MNARRKLTDILHAGDRDKLTKAWHQTKAAEDFAPLPKGEYVALIIDGTLAAAKTGTPSYKLTFQVVEGEHAGRRFWHDVYLTEAAMPMAKRDLGKLGVTDLAQLDTPLPAGIKCRVQLALRREDDGSERNRVLRFAVISIDTPEPDAFAPTDPVEGEPLAVVDVAGKNGEAKDELFAFEDERQRSVSGGTLTVTLPYGFRIVGNTWERRRLVDAGAAFQGYAECDGRPEVEREAYLSAFCFGTDFRQLLESTGSTAGFAGDCWSAWLWFDIDRADNLDAALLDARRLAAFILARFSTLDEADLLAFHSGSKGFHVGIPSCAWGPEPSPVFNRIARRFAARIAEAADIAIDMGVYDKVRAFRAPNSRHPKTGRHKRRLTHDELMGLSLDGILHLAERPEPFDIPKLAGRDQQASADWLDAARLVEQAANARSKRYVEGNGTPTLNRLTLNFIRDGADQGDRHRLLFSAAANLAEFGCPPTLAHALLSEAALDSGLPPGDVRRQIDCGLAHGKGTGNG